VKGFSRGRFPRFSRPDRFSKARATQAGRAARGASSRSGPRFSGRTPTVLSAGRESRVMGGEALRRGHLVRAWAWRTTLICALLSLLLPFARAALGNEVPWPAVRALKLFANTGSATGAANSWAKASLPAVERSWGETALALPVFLGEWTQRLDPQEGGAWGAVFALLCAWLLAVAWWTWAKVGRWRRPSLPLTLLVLAQGFGAFYFLSSFRAPIRALRPQASARAFDFHVHTTRSNGLLTPQQQVDWHRARGFGGLAFTDTNRFMDEAELEALRGANLDMVLLNGAEYHGRDGHVVLLGQISPQGSFSIPQAREFLKASGKARGGGVFAVAAHPWSGDLSLAEWTPYVQGVEAWNGVVGNRDLALRAQKARRLAVGGTDSASKSGADAYVWNLLPASAQSPSQVLAAMRAGRVVVVQALTPQETPSGFEQRRAQSKRPGIVARSWREAWSKLSRTQRLVALLQLAALLSLGVWWGSRDETVAQEVQGPQSARNFLKRKRLVLRVCGALAMLLAFVGSAALAVAAMSGTWKGAAPAWLLTPAVAIAGWALLDVFYVWGAGVLRRIH
jgi:hypothetical protein